MPRRTRIASGGLVFHVMNRAVRRGLLFTDRDDYAAFEHTLFEALHRVPLRLLAYCAMPNHWHLVLWPDEDHHLSAFMHWLTTTHAQRWHRYYGTGGTGALYQGRFKSVPIQTDKHLFWACRYVERNPLRAGLVERAEHWRWSSLWRMTNNCDEQFAGTWPILRPRDWTDYVNRPQTEAEIEALRSGIRWGVPVGDEDWQLETAARLKLPPQPPTIGRPPVHDIETAGSSPAHKTAKRTPDPV